MNIINTTPVPTERLKQLIRFCMPPDNTRNRVRQIEFNNTRHNGTHGRAWGRGGRVHCKIPVAVNVERKRGGFRGYLEAVHYTREEDVVHLIAHELRHVWQAFNKIPRDTRKVRRYQMGTHAALHEVDASRYAIQKVREFRRIWESGWKLIPPEPVYCEPSPEALAKQKNDAVAKKLEKLYASQKVWTRKSKLAATKLKNLARAIKRLEAQKAAAR